MDEQSLSISTESSEAISLTPSEPDHEVPPAPVKCTLSDEANLAIVAMSQKCNTAATPADLHKLGEQVLAHTEQLELQNENTLTIAHWSMGLSLFVSFLLVVSWLARAMTR